MSTRVFVCKAGELVPGEVRVVSLRKSSTGRPREAIVLRDEDGQARAYHNVCSHLPIPLDAASRRFLKDGAIQCATHGARYRLRDGLCVAGPCQGTSLQALPVEANGDDVAVVDSDET